MIPAPLLVEIDGLVADGTYPDRNTAVAELLKIGLAARRAKPREPVPGRPPMPPGVREPHDDRPIEVNPTDVNWMP